MPSEVRQEEWDQWSEHLTVEDDSAEVPEFMITEGTLDQGISEQGHYGAALNEEHKRVAREVHEEVKLQNAPDDVIKVNTNVAGQARFRTYQLGGNLAFAVRILDDKDYRGDTTITVISGGPVSIGRSQGITAVGQADTVQINLNGSRSIRTRDEIWAYASNPTVLDVQEEFN